MSVSALLLMNVLLLTSPQELAQRLQLSISNGQSAYYIKERVVLKVSLRNTSGDVVEESLRFSPTNPDVEVLYRRVGGTFTRFRFTTEELPLGDGISRTETLSPAEERTGGIVLAFDSTTNQFVLPSPGDYEFQVRYRLSRTDVLASEVVHVHADRPPRSEEEAAAEYSAEVARFSQLGLQVYAPSQDIIAQAATFLERHRDSVYAGPVREGLFRVLNDRIVAKTATPKERDIHARLKTERDSQTDRDIDNDRDRRRPARQLHSCEVHFEARSARLDTDAGGKLSEIVEEMKTNGHARAVVEAHADGQQEAPSVESSVALSDQRAAAVRDELVRLGVPADRIRVSGLGRERPACQEQADSCYAKNRRVEVSIVP